VFGVEFFNADDVAAQLNQGSYRGIPQSIRDRVNRLFESFVNDCIVRRVSFARAPPGPCFSAARSAAQIFMPSLPRGTPRSWIV
jgi:hypothetical protein